MAMFNKKVGLALWLYSSSQLGYAIGLDELKPQVDKPANNSESINEAEPTPAEKPKATPPVSPEVAPLKKDPEAVKEVGDETPAKGPEAVKQPSALSQKLAEKMYLASGLGFANIKGPKGTWSTLGNADALVAYQLAEFQGKTWRLFGAYHFAPYDVVVKKDAENYRGNIDTHGFGVTLRHKSGRMEVHTSGELVAQIVHLKQTDEFKPKENLEKNGFAANLGGGVDWRILEKLQIGPRLHVGLGTYMTAQLLCNLGFVF